MIENEETEINIRAPRYFIALATDTCPRCSETTRLVALALPQGHELFEPDDPEAAAGTWCIAARGAFIFQVEFVPGAARRRLNALAPFYRPDTSGPDRVWVNHCEHCAAPFDDHDLFCEPDGAFLPTSEARAAAIRLSPVDEGLVALAAGYAYDPMFFDAMDRDE